MILITEIKLIHLFEEIILNHEKLLENIIELEMDINSGSNENIKVLSCVISVAHYEGQYILGKRYTQFHYFRKLMV